MSRSAVDQAAVGSWLVRDSNPRTLTGDRCERLPRCRVTSARARLETIDDRRRSTAVDGDGDGNGDDDEDEER